MAGSLSWVLANDTLSFSGRGAMPDYLGVPSPWTDNKNVKSIIIGDGITGIGIYAFDGCSNLASIMIPYSVRTIGSYAFVRCSALVSIAIPSAVGTIGGGAFHSCTSLASITIPNAVTQIGLYAFSGCTGLADVTVEWAAPISIAGGVFENVGLSAATLHVPAGTKALYEAAPVWKEFGTIKEDAGTGMEAVDVANIKAYLHNHTLYISSPAAETIEVYSFSGAKLFSAHKDAGEATFTVPTILKAVIVRGSSGWTLKTINN
jgi:hypothetical protein